MVVLNPVHNLFLGTTRYILKTLCGNPVLTPSNLLSLQESIASMHVSLDIAGIPRKIETGFSGCTADQYKNRVTLSSIPCLYAVIGREELENWCHVVLACHLLCKRQTLSDVSLSDALLLQFCRRTQ